MNSQVKWSSLKRWFFPIGSFILMVAMVYIASVIYFNQQRTTQLYLPLSDASNEIQTHVAEFHIWLEESIIGDHSLDPESAWTHLDIADEYVQQLKNNNLHDQELELSLLELTQTISNLRLIATQRVNDPATSGIGTALDATFDEVFRKVMRQAKDIEHLLGQAIADAQNRFNQLTLLLISLMVLLSLLLSFLFYLYWVEWKINSMQIALGRKRSHIERLQAIQTLTGGIAHHINNALAGITGNIYLVKKYASHLPSDASMKLNTIESIALRSARMISQLLIYSNNDIHQDSDVTLNNFITKNIESYRLNASQGIDFHINLCREQLTIRFDLQQLEQVLTNLLDNAEQAMKGIERPSIHVGLEKVPTNDQLREKFPELGLGDFACMCIEDHGSGMEPKEIEHIFDPFFTTKEVGDGSGLGLAMVYGAVKAHQGAIDINSRKGKGSQIRVYLPLRIL